MYLASMKHLHSLLRIHVGQYKMTGFSEMDVESKNKLSRLLCEQGFFETIAILDHEVLAGVNVDEIAFDYMAYGIC